MSPCCCRWRPPPRRVPTPAPAGVEIKGQSPDRGRPTRHDDEQPPLDFDLYLLGVSWTFEWDVPEGPLGAAGRITGTTTSKALGGKFYEALTEAAWRPRCRSTTARS